MDRYVCGFYFSTDGDEVVLADKKRPAWQAGRLNGVGGRIEEGETPLEAMRREFLEETGLEVEDWDDFCLHKDTAGTFEVFFFRAFGNDVHRCETTTDEEIDCYPVGSLERDYCLVPTVRWLVPMALDEKLSSAETVWKDLGERHAIEDQESYTVYTLRCGRCGKKFEEKGSRHGRMCTFDVESEGYEVGCPHCHVKLEVGFDDD